MKRILFFAFGAFLAALSASAQILSNGGFEQGLAGWTNSSASGSAATFTIDNGNAHTGAAALKAAVSQTGNSGNQTVHQSFNPSGDSVHLLVFWAKSSVESAQLTINLQGTTTIPCQFKLRTVWHRYLFPFKSNETSLVLKFLYNSVSDYFIDDVEILNQESSNIDVRTLYRWHYKPQTFGLVATDNDISIKLPDGRRVWFFNDTFLGTNNPYDNHLNQNYFARNAMAIESPSGVITTVNHGTQQSPHDFIVPAYPPTNASAPAVNLYWVGDAVIEGGKLKLILIEVIDPKNGNGTYGTGRRDLATFSLPSLTLESVQQLPSTGTDSYEAIIDDGEYWYFYAWISQGWDAWTKVARAAKGNLLGNLAPWEFYNNGSWVTDYTQATTISTRGASAVAKLGPNNYVMIAMPALSGQVQALYAQNPVGPWSTPQLLYQVPTEDPYWTYMPNLHGDRYNSGKYTISYSTNTFESWFTTPGPWGDKYHYLPRYLHVDLLKQSPYTGASLALNKPVTVSSTQGTNNGLYAVDASTTTRWESTYSDPQWLYVDLGNTYTIDRVRITWETALGKDYQIQVSDNATDWTTARSITNNAALVNDYSGLSASGRYVRIYGTARGTMWGYSIYNLEVFGSLTTSVDITNLGGAASAQYNDSPANEGLARIIDNTSATKYLTFHNTAWIQYQAPGQYKVTSYSITSANDAPERDPLNWTLQGSNNGTSWTTIDTRAAQDFPNRLQRLVFNFTNTTAFSYYRFNFTNNSGSLLQVAEVELFGTPAGGTAARMAGHTEEENTVTVGNADKVTVHPVPSGNALHVRGLHKTDKLEVLDLTGRVCKVPANRTESTAEFDITGLSAGSYLLVITSGKKKETVRFQKR
jgi:hypothetical protein